MIGGMSLNYSYEDSDGQVHTGVEAGDVVYMMDQYAGRLSTYDRVYDDGLKTTKVDYAVSNPEYTFRGGKTDRFFLNVSDITKLLNLSFFVKSDRSTVWNISDVTVHLVNGVGRRYINASGELSYRYNDGEELKFITDWTNNETMEVVIPVFGGGTSGKQQVDIQLNDAPIKTDKSTNTWSAVVNREPKSKNDTLNLFIYPSTADKASNPSTYNLSASVNYVDAMTMGPMTAGCGQLDFSYDRNNQPVFSKIGVSASNLDSITSVSVKTASAGTLQAPISYGIIQRIRSGVLIDTYYLTGASNADRKSTLSITQKPKVDTAVQRLFLQVYANNPLQDLIAVDKDVALAVYFRPTGAMEQELRSKYIYLTDVGYTTIKPGQLLELDYNLGDVAEILGVNVVKTGALDISFENVMIASQNPSGEIIGKYSIENGFIPSTIPSRVNAVGDVEKLKLKIRTGEATETTGGGTMDPVRLTIGYYDKNGSEQTEVINNIRPYLEANRTGKALTAGAEDTFEMLVPGLTALRYVTLEPYNADAASYASWTLENITASVGLDGAEVSRTVSKTIVEESPETIFVEEILVISGINVSTSDGKRTTGTPELTIKESPDAAAKQTDVFTIKSPEIGTLSVDSGARVLLNTRVSGSSQGYTCRFMQVDPDNGLTETADLSKGTYSYTEEELDEIYALAVQSLGADVTNNKEIEAAKQVVELINTMRAGRGSLITPDTEDYNTRDITFQTPKNYSDQKLTYRIVVTSKENPSCSYTLDVIVGREDEKLTKAIEEWDKVRSVGEVSVLSETGAVEETTSLLLNDRKSLLIKSGEGVKVVPRVSDSDGFTAVVNSYDPATQAKGRAELGVRHSYPEDTLLRYESEANTILSSAESTDDERTEAQNVLNIISAMRAGNGDFSAGTSEILLNAPKNYSGSAVSYIITVTNSKTASELFSLIVTVNAETDTLQTAYDQLTKAKAVGDEARKAAEQQNSSNGESTDNTNPDTNANTDNTNTTPEGSDANTGDNTGSGSGANSEEGGNAGGEGENSGSGEGANSETTP